MSMWGLTLLVALVGGLELAVRGHLGDRPGPFHAGLWLLAAALLTLTVLARRRGRARAAALPGVLAGALASLSIAELGLARWGSADGSTQPTGAPAQIEGFGPKSPRSGAIGAPEGAGYRIVTLGGSAAFAAPSAGEPAWPALLERRIREQLVCDSPVRVLDAGRPGADLARSLAALETELLPLEPHLLIVQVGGADLKQLANEVGIPPVGTAPRVPARASRIVRALETGLRERSFARRWHAARAFDVETPALDETRTLARYRKLIVEARRNRIEVRLLTISLAANERSPEEAIRVHEETFPATRRAIVANRLHTRLLRSVAARYGGRALDTSAGLDGAGSDVFADLVHPTPAGHERLARNVLEGLRGLLARPRPGCRQRTPASAS